jgi:hypothetical protein
MIACLCAHKIKIVRFGSRFACTCQELFALFAVMSVAPRPMGIFRYAMATVRVCKTALLRVQTAATSLEDTRRAVRGRKRWARGAQAGGRSVLDVNKQPGPAV